MSTHTKLNTLLKS